MLDPTCSTPSSCLTSAFWGCSWLIPASRGELWEIFLSHVNQVLSPPSLYSFAVFLKKKSKIIGISAKNRTCLLTIIAHVTYFQKVILSFCKPRMRVGQGETGGPVYLTDWQGAHSVARSPVIQQCAAPKMAAAAKAVKMSKFRPTMDQAKVTNTYFIIFCVGDSWLCYAVYSATNMCIDQTN